VLYSGGPHGSAHLAGVLLSSGRRLLDPPSAVRSNENVPLPLGLAGEELWGPRQIPVSHRRREPADRGNLTWAEYENLPFAPGTSPFHLKGIAYRGHVEYTNRFIRGGARAVIASFRNPALAAFFDQPFLAATWYDALPILSVWYATARLLNQPPIDFLRTRTRHQAEEDIHGAYRLILNLASAEAVLLRVPRVVGKYFDFGATESHVLRPGVVRFCQTGVPLLMAPWFAIVGETYVRVALEIAGAKRARVRRAPAEPSGEAYGMALVSLAMEVEITPESNGH
jgi:hypothetical protein